MLRSKIFRSRWLAITWLVLISILFFLPGKDLPDQSWRLMRFLNEIYFDKWVHVGFFTVLVFLWKGAFEGVVNNYTAILFMSAVLYGFVVELIQYNWVPDRSFDLYDILCDTAGSLLGIFLWQEVYKKNKPL